MIRIFLILALCCPFLRAAELPPLPVAHTMRTLDGWQVRVDDRLLHGLDAAVGEKVVALLTARLVAVSTVVPEPALSKLRGIVIQVDLNCGGLKNLQYHPSADWLRENGYPESLARCVHLPVAANFLSPSENARMPWVVLHELAHGYHDQVLGFDDARVLAAWKTFRDSGKYNSVLTRNGGQREHYGLTDQKEFFAEMTESYFGSNDFFPFVAGELKQTEPEIYSLLEEIWGKVP
jgi:hypothetical protein